LKRLATTWWRLGLPQRGFLERAFYRCTDLPVLGDIYHFVYKFQINRRASHSLNEMEIETYNVCNLKCVMCPYPAMTRKKTQMDMALFKRIIDDAAGCGIRRVGLNFYSEPLLDPLIFDRIRYAKSRGLTVEFYSNGTLLTQDRAEKLLDSGLDTVIFSFDGATKATFEKIRVGADFEETRDNIRLLLQKRNGLGLKRPRVVIYLVAQRDNIGEIEQFKTCWSGIADEVWTGEVDARKNDAVLPEGRRYGDARPKRLYPCKSIFKRLEVMSDGRVALCPFDYDGSVVLGDLTRETINQVWNSREYRRIRDLHLSGRAHELALCRETGCQAPYWGAYCWWTWRQFG
jgi:MoaA/NifB/PqqE/SkfB family radical SAM enzyme